MSYKLYYSLLTLFTIIGIIIGYFVGDAFIKYSLNNKTVMLTNDFLKLKFGTPIGFGFLSLLAGVYLLDFIEVKYMRLKDKK